MNDAVPATARGTWVEGMRALCDVLAADVDVPLPLHAAAAFTFSTTEAAARLLAVHLDGAHETQRPRAFALDRMITGTLAGQAVTVYFGTSRTGATA
jgi:hypothetical protein